MNTSTSQNELNRRDFLKTTAGVAAVAAIAPSLAGVANAADTAPQKMIGIQIGPISFVDEGVENVLDILQQKGAINTIFLTTFTYGRGLGGRQIPGLPFPDHGKQESDESFFHGGIYST